MCCPISQQNKVRLVVQQPTATELWNPAVGAHFGLGKILTPESFPKKEQRPGYPGFSLEWHFTLYF